MSDGTPRPFPTHLKTSSCYYFAASALPHVNDIAPSPYSTLSNKTSFLQIHILTEDLQKMMVGCDDVDGNDNYSSTSKEGGQNGTNTGKDENTQSRTSSSADVGASDPENSDESLVEGLQSPPILTLRSFTVASVEIFSDNPPTSENNSQPSFEGGCFNITLDGVNYDNIHHISLIPFQSSELDISDSIEIATFNPQKSVHECQSAFSELYAPFKP